MKKYKITLEREIECEEDVLWECIGEQWCDWMDYANAEEVEEDE